MYTLSLRFRARDKPPPHVCAYGIRARDKLVGELWYCRTRGVPGDGRSTLEQAWPFTHVPVEVLLQPQPTLETFVISYGLTALLIG